VTDWQLVCLAAMAIALVVMALVQVGLIVVALKLARQVTSVVDDVRRDVRPLVEKAHRIADDAQRAASLAAVQVERLDAMLATTTARLDHVLGVLQNAFSGPVRQGAAAMAVIRAIMGAVRQWQARDQRRREEDDGLFVG
jgi:hypothetical protein